MITSAALIMIAVFLSFVASPVPSLKMLGLGLAVAILVDATIVRMVLVPATMALLGKANWWLPAWLDRILPHLTIEGSTTTRRTSPTRRPPGPMSSWVADLSPSSPLVPGTVPGAGGLVTSGPPTPARESRTGTRSPTPP